MSEMGYEAPDADSAEQELDAVPEPDEGAAPAALKEAPLEVNEADAAEQDQALGLDEDEYR